MRTQRQNRTVDTGIFSPVGSPGDYRAIIGIRPTRVRYMYTFCAVAQ